MVAWDEVADGYRYVYRLQGPIRKNGFWGHVEMDIRVPKAAESGRVVPIGGTWLGDDARSLNADTTWGRVALEVSIPQRWYGYTTSMGRLAWTAPQARFMSVSGGVKPGDVLDGFVVKSPGVPSLRDVDVLPGLFFLPEEEKEAKRKLSAIVVERGVLVGPGRPASHLSLWSLADEVRQWCASGEIGKDECEEWRRAVLGAIQASKLGAGGVLVRQWANIDKLLLGSGHTAAAKRVLGLHVRLLRGNSAKRLVWDVPDTF